MQDIHEIRPPVAIGIDPAAMKLFLVILACLLLSGLLVFLIRKWWKKRKNKELAEAAIIPLTPFEEAVQALASIAQKKADADPRLLYYDLTFVLRQYMGRSFQINAVEMTSEEFLRETGRLDLEKEIKKQISYFHALSDPFKYAGIQPEKEMVAKDLKLLCSLIETIEKSLTEKKETA